MKVSESANRVRAMIEKAIEDHQITRAEYEMIIHHVLEDAQVDSQERALIRELQDMIDNKDVKLVP
jgi:uncharacterized membrane protein YebE (DUF533 family)